jgi:hypothetical protein
VVSPDKNSHFLFTSNLAAVLFYSGLRILCGSTVIEENTPFCFCGRPPVRCPFLFNGVTNTWAAGIKKAGYKNLFIKAF